MLEFITADGNTPFAVALGVLFGIALLEGITTLLGMGLSSLLDSLLPDLDLNPDIDTTAPDYPSGNGLTRLLGWLRIGQVPALILLVILLTGFGLIGLTIQSFAQSLSGRLLPGAVASIPALLLALPLVRLLGGVLARLLPKDETDAVSLDVLVGRVGVITLGKACRGSPAEARVTDIRGTTQYVMVEPDSEDGEFPAGTRVLLVRRVGAVFKAIVNPSPSLVDKEND